MLFVGLVAAASFAGLAYVTAKPPPSMRADRDGVPYFTPPVLDPVSGRPVAMSALVRHYKGVE